MVEHEENANDGKGRPRKSMLALHYSRIVDDEAKSEKEREAALLLALAESRLNEEPEDVDEVVDVADQARERFRDLGDLAGLAHCRRLLAHCRRLSFLQPEAVVDQSGPPPSATEPEENLHAEEEGRADDLMVAAQESLRQDAEKAKTAAAEALLLFRRLGDKTAAGDAMRVLVQALRETEGDEVAEQQAREELERCQDMENLYGEAAMLVTLAEILHGKGASSLQALDMATQAQEICQQRGDDELEAAALLVLSQIYASASNGKEALRAASDALVLFRSLDDQEGATDACGALARGYRLCGQPHQALRWALAGRAQAQELLSGRLELPHLLLAADLQLEAGDHDAALRDAQEAVELSLSNAFGRGREQIQALVLLVRVRCAAGQLDEALAAAASALQRFQGLACQEGQAVALDLLSQCHLSMLDPEQAAECAEAALSIIREIGDEEWEAKVLRRVSSTKAPAIAADNDDDNDHRESTAEHAVAMLREPGEGDGDFVLRLQTLIEVHAEKQAWEAVRRTAERAVELLDGLDDAESKARTLCSLAQAQLQLERIEAAGSAASQAERICEELGDVAAWIQALHVRSQVSLAKGDFKQAASEADKALALTRRDRQRYKREEVTLLLYLNHIHHTALLTRSQEGSSQDSRLYKDLLAKVDRGAAAAVKGATDLGDKPMLAIAKFRYGQSSLLCGRFAEALDANDGAMRLFRESGDLASEGNCALVKSDVLQALGRPEEAMEAAQQAEALGHTSNDATLVAEAALRLGPTKPLGGSLDDVATSASSRDDVATSASERPD